MRIATCPNPPWFNGSEFFIEIIFAIAAFLVAFYAYRVYRFTRQRSILLFGIGFASMTLGYFVQAALNFLLFKSIYTNDIIAVVTGTTSSVVSTSLQLSVLATFFHIAFITFGLAMIAYVTLAERGVKIFLLIMSLAFVGLVFSATPLLAFYIITSVFLLFITAQYYQRHARVRSMNTLYVYLGFGLLLLGNIQFAISGLFSTLYISALVTLVIGYALLIASLVRVVRR